MEGSEFCFSHNPKTQEDKKKAVLKGGLSPKPRKEAKSLEPLSIRSIEDILMIIEDTINRVRTEPITHQKANCIGYLANVALRIFQQGDFELKKEPEEDKKKVSSTEGIDASIKHILELREKLRQADEVSQAISAEKKRREEAKKVKENIQK